MQIGDSDVRNYQVLHYIEGVPSGIKDARMSEVSSKGKVLENQHAEVGNIRVRSCEI